MRRSAGLLSLLVALAACGDATADPVTTLIPETPVPTATDGCVGNGFEGGSVSLRLVEASASPSQVPVRLGVATDAVPATLLDGVHYVGCQSEWVDDLAFEAMAWTNGIGLLFIYWQEWPGDGDLGSLPLGGDIQQAGIVQVSSVDQLFDENSRTRIVHLYDGARVVTVATFSLTTLSIEKVEEIGWAVYDAIPVDPSSRAGVGVTRTLDELMVALASGQLTVEAPEGVHEMSPFTSALGVAHATQKFIVGGNTVTVFDFGGVGAADRAAAVISSDGYTIAHLPYEVSATPHYWQWDRLIVQFMGDSGPVIALFEDVIGSALVGGIPAG